MNLYIIRHGETDYNLQGIVQGSGVDTDLNDTGRNQAQLFYAKYAAIPFEIAIVSRLKRTWQTVQPFTEKGLPMLVDTRLNEINWGTHEGKKSTPESRIDYRRASTSWKNGDYTDRTELGESAEELAARLTDFIEDLKLRSEKNLLLATHGRTLRCLICLLKGEPISNMDQYDHYNTGLVLAHYDTENGMTVSLENDVSHLPEYRRHDYGL
jgi:broad specificity phosphatase PhoE